MLEKAIKYFNKEYKEVKEYVENKNTCFPLAKKSKRLAVDRTVARCLGVAMFVQECGVTYDKIAPPFEEVKIKLMKLLESEE